MSHISLHTSQNILALNRQARHHAAVALAAWLTGRWQAGLRVVRQAIGKTADKASHKAVSARTPSRAPSHAIGA
jgi:hypothetical protein